MIRLLAFAVKWGFRYQIALALIATGVLIGMLIEAAMIVAFQTGHSVGGMVFQ